MKSLIEGIRVVGDKIVFDFNNDDINSDVISLKFQKFNKKLSTRAGTEIYFGYKYNQNVSPDDLALVRNSIKMMDTSLIRDQDLRLMVFKAVNNFLKMTGNDYDVIITPKSSSPLVNMMAQFFKDKIGSNVLLASDSIVKNAVENIKIEPKVNQTLSPEQQKNVNNAIKSATKTGSFKMKSIPIPMRRIIIDFMKFKDDTSRQIFNSISNGKVLLIDDIYTGGSTFAEMTRIINEQNPNKITGFVLLLSS